MAGDGAEGVTIQATYTDGRRLDKVVRLVLTATGPDGQRIGPVQLDPQPEGHGFYSSGPVLSTGKWKVTVNSPGSAAEQGHRHGAGEGGTVTAGARAGRGDRSRPDGGAGAGWWPFAAAGLVLVAAAMGVAMLFGRRRTD